MKLRIVGLARPGFQLGAVWESNRLAGTLVLLLAYWNVLVTVWWRGFGSAQPDGLTRLTKSGAVSTSLSDPRFDSTAAYAAFGRWCFETMREEQGDIDGGWAQDKALELGLLERVLMTEPCHPDCWCSEFHGEFPVQCLRERLSTRNVTADTTLEGTKP